MRSFGAILLCSLGLLARAEEETFLKMDEPTKQATARAIKWLAEHQGSDGSWGSQRYERNTGITGFVVLAFLSQGHLPGQGEYGECLDRAKKFLVRSGRDDGYLIGPKGGNMYCHGMATLALAELSGGTGDRELRPVLKKAVDLIVGSQNKEGGWRYSPQPNDADISVTIMQVMALRAAKNGGASVPEKTLKNAIAYIKTLQHDATGGFCYQRKSDGPGFARTAAGVCSLLFAGEYESKEVTRGLEYLSQFDLALEKPLPRKNGEVEKKPVPNEHFWYGQYYAAHAMHQAGGKYWREWYPTLCSVLLKNQSPDGHWNWKNHEGVGDDYMTAIAVITLSIPAGYVPIFQR